MPNHRRYALAGRPTPRTLAAMAAALLLATACAHRGATYAGTTGEVVLAQVGEAPLREADLPEQTQGRLFALDNAYAQQRFVTLWTGVEDAIGDRLLEAEARRRGVPVARLLAVEVDEKVGGVSDGELRDVYDSNRTAIGVPFAEAAPYLREQVLRERAQALRRALVDRLRQRHEVTLSLPLPDLRRVAVAADANAPSLGPVAAPVTLVVFSDFQCPYSAQARRLVRRLSELYPDELRVVLRQFPLEQHNNAARAAEASLCAHAQRRFWPLYEQLFENMGHLEQAALPGYVEAAQLDVVAFNACMAQGAMKEVLRRDVLEGQALGIKGTPAMYLNGMPLMGVLPLPVMQALVAREQAQAGES